ncbi:Receptor-like cytosolic serine/threonine-protein kinase RBK2 [Linum grandiflorum]
MHFIFILFLILAHSEFSPSTFFPQVVKVRKLVVFLGKIARSRGAFFIFFRISNRYIHSVRRGVVLADVKEMAQMYAPSALDHHQWIDGSHDNNIIIAQNHQGDVVSDKHNKKRSSKMASSASAHDLRNFAMEKEKQDVSSPRGVIEACLNGWEHDSEDSAEASNQDQLLQVAKPEHSKTHSHWKKFFKVWKLRPLKRLAHPTMPRAPRRSKSAREDPVLRDLYNFKSSLKNFTYSELKAATDHFSKDNLIGKGGFAEVYKGHLPDGKLIAIKRLIRGTNEEKTTGFLSEIGILAHVDHPNTARLLGCGIEGGMHLIFELSPLGSLRTVLHESEVKPVWSKRYKIALGTADGLLYLHETCRKRIIHRDIKVDNILLTENFEPQICDFGLAKWLPKQLSHHHVSKFEGTFGYFAPEYFMHGIVDEKTDVYAFGVILLELITGRQAVLDSQHSLVIWAKPLLDNNDVEELVDPALDNNYDSKEMDHMLLTASLCIERSPILRPRMSQVAILLRGDDYALECAKQDQKRALHRTYSNELLDAQEYNSTKYLSLRDINRLKEIAFCT